MNCNNHKDKQHCFKSLVLVLMYLAGMAKLILYLANGTQHEAKGDSRSEPAVFKYAASALKVEHVSAVQLKKEAQRAKAHNENKPKSIRLI